MTSASSDERGEHRCCHAEPPPQAKHLTDNSSYDLYVCRDAGGLYALSAICPHQGCTVSHSSSRFAWYQPLDGVDEIYYRALP